MKNKTSKNKKKVTKVFLQKNKNVRLIDIAKQVGVGVSTVSRILNGTPNSIRVTEKTRSMVLNIAQDLGYASHHIPAKYHKGVRSVMVISHDPGEIFYQKIISSIERTLRSKGYACYFSYTEADPVQAGELIDAMGERFTSGCVVFQREKEVFTKENEFKLKNLGLPCVVVDRHPLPRPSFISTVELDHELAGYSVASHLLHLGHRNFAFLSVPDSPSSCVERRKGVEKSLEEVGLKLDPKFIAKINPEARFKLHDLFESWASKGKNFPTAIITVHDELGYAAMNVLENMGFCIPDDISITGFDDRAEMVPWGLDNVRIPLTSIHQPIEAIGIAAGNELIARIKNSELEPEHIRLKGELMIRSSTSSPKKRNFRLAAK